MSLKYYNLSFTHSKMVLSIANLYINDSIQYKLFVGMAILTGL